MKERKDYEIKAEIIVKQLKAKIYELEAKALEAKMNADSGMSDLEENINRLANQREKLDAKYDELKNASNDKWEALVSEFEEFLEIVNADKQDFSDKVEGWIVSLGEKIEELEQKAKLANEDIKLKMQEQITALKKHKINLEGKLNEVKKSQDENWQKIKDGFEENLTKVKDSVNQAISYIKK
jgi:hypothetical protein